MATFMWEGRTATGEIRKGQMDAANDQEVMNRLRAQQIVPNKVKKKMGNIELTIPGIGGVSTKDLVVFTRQFSTMIDAGLPQVGFFGPVLGGAKRYAAAGASLQS